MYVLSSLLLNLPHPPKTGGLCGSIEMCREVAKDIGAIHGSSQTRKMAKREFLMPITSVYPFKT
jgi:hypothetical protein